MCCKSWLFWVGLLGVCVIGAIIRMPAAVVRAEGRDGTLPPPTEVRHERGRGSVVNVNLPNGDGDLFVNGRWKKTEVLLETKAEGYGATDEDAIESAVKDACGKIESFLEKTYGETQYKATPNDLVKKGVVTAETKKAAQIETMTSLTDHPQRAVLQVVVTSDQVKEMRKEARDVRIHDRMKWGGLALAALVGLLLVGGGYLRLEEATKGYYTTLLRVAALALVGAIGATLWMLWP